METQLFFIESQDFRAFFNAYVYYLNGEIDLTSGETGNCTR